MLARRLCTEFIDPRPIEPILSNRLIPLDKGNGGVRLPHKTNRAAELAAEKGASHWLTVIPVKDMNCTLNKREFRDAIHLRYDWNINDIPFTCVCGDNFDIYRAMVCRRGGFVIQCHNEIRDLEVDLLNLTTWRLNLYTKM